MIILGIDPGSRAMGLGLVRLEGGRVRYLAHGVIRPPSGPLPARLACIHAGVSACIEEWRPERAALESVFQHRNPRAALMLGHARGVALAACGLAGLPCSEYAPAHVKAAVTGTGAASKSQVQAMVQRLLGLSAPPPLDAADALAVALCYAHGEGSPGAERVARAARAADVAARS